MDMKYGKGKYTYSDGSMYVGDWDKDQRRGKGKIAYQNGDWFEGTFDDDTQEGVSGYCEWRIDGQTREG